MTTAKKNQVYSFGVDNRSLDNYLEQPDNIRWKKYLFDFFDCEANDSKLAVFNEPENIISSELLKKNRRQLNEKSM